MQISIIFLGLLVTEIVASPTRLFATKSVNHHMTFHKTWKKPENFKSETSIDSFEKVVKDFFFFWEGCRFQRCLSSSTYR
ncbi:BgtE-5563 [Blumeria graminis f. sp. tritici]|uniref:BgtE-5563 n=2 Tax=Blumeria graminis f. sp. tritici TaxID=62690 RepID=A0A061HHW8_BLUGR|nr:putative secreted effector protein [Blumeria graminis f. sp. tritici 96224]VDB92533.1 BgtE-5563 [Blumeria graminis f. sp. tritici]